MWYVIQVRTGREHDIITMYEKRIKVPDEEIFIIRCMRFIRNPGGGFHEQEANAFPGYVFADTHNIEDLIERLRDIPELTKVIGAGEEIFPIYKEEEDILKFLVGDNHLIGTSKGIIKNNRIIITSGNLAGHEGMIVWVNRHRKVACIEIDISGHKVKTKVGLEIEERID
ncbi:MAG: antiterminator LoaP [Butyrivibrio sp.]|nr:antiterminator LoaP [Butyrivibrio sp.]MBP3196045.1 antiterminator LoaP [Butyrivibrio sp.]